MGGQLPSPFPQLDESVADLGYNPALKRFTSRVGPAHAVIVSPHKRP
jgi:hypothetical protein